MSGSFIEHYTTMVSGCESINGGDYNTPDAKYAFTVLQLHANDVGLYAGQEGFIDEVKKGAKSLGKWILQLINDILDGIMFYFGGRNAVKAKLRAFKQHSAFDVFKSKLTKNIEKTVLPTLARIFELCESIITVEYQEYYRGKLPDNDQIMGIFLNNNKIEDMIKDAIKKADGNPSEECLDFDDIVNEAQKAMKVAKSYISSIRGREDENKGVVRNLGSVVSKYGKIISAINKANTEIEATLK